MPPRRTVSPRGRRWRWLLVVMGLVSPVIAQQPDADWRTRETEHFRIHYPAPAEAWVTRLASRLDALWLRVGETVGHTPETTIDVVVADPLARANGSAYPILGMPRMVLWTTPPGPDSVIGHYRDWGSLLAIHEAGHLAHLLRPSRNRLVRLSRLLVPAGPLARKAPRWVVEGYATWLEGELTGAGRPNSDLRAAILRRWAQRGTIPDYGRLSADGASWMGMSMAYLMGSAYLEWLVQRTGPESLPNLWARMSARVDRSFDAAFAGVHGDTPRRLYDRFRAELTYEALRLEADRGPALRTGEAWLNTSWSTSAPAVSPDGMHLAVVRRARERPSRLEIHATEGPKEPDEAEDDERHSLARALDPEDVQAVAVGPPSRRARFVLETRDGAEPYAPRWLGDSALLFVRFVLGADGVRRPDLFRWMLGAPKAERLTRGAGVRDPDPAPDGTWAVAVRHDWGASRLVRVALDGPRRGEVDPLTPARVDTVYAHPRVAPSADRVAYAVHRGAGWRLEVLYLDENRVETVAAPASGTLSHPAWSADGHRLWATVGAGGYLEIVEFDLLTGRAEPTVRNHGAALAPAPMPDGASLFYLSLEPVGLVVHRREFADPMGVPSGEGIVVDADEQSTTRDLLIQPEIRATDGDRVDPVDEPRAASAAPAASRPYRLGRLEWLPLLAGAWAPGASFIEAGARVGDLVGRLDVVALGTTGATADGAALGVTYRGWPITLEATVSSLRLSPSRQPRSSANQSSANQSSANQSSANQAARLDREQGGLQLLGRWRRVADGGRFDLALGGYRGTIERDASREDQTVGFARARASRHHRRGGWRWSESLDVGLDIGRTGDDHWRRRRLGARVGVTHGGWGLGVSWQRHRADGAASNLDQLQVGGLAPSLRPEALALGWIEAPALPVGALVGTRHEAQRVELRLGSAPLRVFAARHRFHETGAGDWLRLVGVELAGQRAAWPLVRLPALDWTVGIAGVLDPPFEDNFEGWISLRWRP